MKIAPRKPRIGRVRARAAAAATTTRCQRRGHQREGRPTQATTMRHGQASTEGPRSRSTMRPRARCGRRRCPGYARSPTSGNTGEAVGRSATASPPATGPSSARTKVAAGAAVPVPSNRRPPRKTVVPSGPRGTFGIGIRRGSSVVTLILVEETPAVFELLLTVRGERRRQP